MHEPKTARGNNFSPLRHCGTKASLVDDSTQPDLLLLFIFRVVVLNLSAGAITPITFTIRCRPHPCASHSCIHALLIINQRSQTSIRASGEVTRQGNNRPRPPQAHQHCRSKLSGRVQADKAAWAAGQSGATQRLGAVAQSIKLEPIASSSSASPLPRIFVSAPVFASLVLC